MKKYLRCKKIMSIVLLVALIITTKVYAAQDHFETTLTVNHTQVKAGDTITLTIGLNNIAIESGEKGIGGYTSSVNFDSSVLEYVSTNGNDKWDAPFYQNKLITAVTKDGNVVNTPQSIGTITFKVKKDAKVGETTISLENFSGTTGLGGTDLNTSNQSIKIAIIANSNVGENHNPGNSNQDSKQPTNNNPTNQTPSSSGSKGNVTNTTANTNKANTKQGVLPRAGSENIKVFTTIGILLTIVLYIRFKIVDRKIKK